MEVIFSAALLLTILSVNSFRISKIPRLRLARKVWSPNASINLEQNSNFPIDEPPAGSIEDGPSWRYEFIKDLTRELEELDESYSAADATIQEATSDVSIATTKSDTEKKPRRILLARFVSWILRKVVQSTTKFTSGLHIHVDANSNKDILRGRVNNIEILFDKISYPQLCISAGGRLNIEGIDLKMRRFLFSDVIQSLRTPYKLSGDLLLTQEDVVNSKFIRDLIQMLVNTILTNALKPAAGLVNVIVRRVYIHERQLVATGDVWPKGSGEPSISFEVSLGAEVKEEGRVIELKDIQLILNPDSILLKTSIPIPLAVPLDIDIGPDCRLETIMISHKHVWIKFNSTISPVTPFNVVQSEKRAMFYYDLAALLSSILKLRGGVALRWVGSYIS